MAHLPSWFLPAALADGVFFVGLVIAFLMSFIIQNHQIRTRVLILPLIGAVVIGLTLTTMVAVQQNPATPSTPSTPSPASPPSSIHGPSVPNTIPPTTTDIAAPPPSLNPAEPPPSIPSKDQIADCLDHHFGGGSAGAYRIYGFQYNDLGTTATMHISTSSVPYALIRYNQNCQLSIAATVPANSTVDVPVWTGSLWTLDRASVHRESLQSLNGSPPPIYHNGANSLYRFDDGVSMTYSY